MGPEVDDALDPAHDPKRVHEFRQILTDLLKRGRRESDFPVEFVGAVDDFRALPRQLQASYLEQIEVIKADPRLGEHLDRRASTGDLSAYRKVKFGHDTPRGPSHRISCQRLPDSYIPSQFRAIAVRSRADDSNIAAKRLDE